MCADSIKLDYLLWDKMSVRFLRHFHVILYGKGSEAMRLLVVEDDRLLNNTLCYNLSAAGYTVDAAMSKSAAVNFCEAQDYDLIVLDVNLPDGNGFDFCTEIKERRPDTAVIFLTANDMESDMLDRKSVV